MKIDARVYPHAAFWYSMVSKFAPGKLPAPVAKPAAAKPEAAKPEAAKPNAAPKKAQEESKGGKKGKQAQQPAAGKKEKGKGKPPAPKDVSDIGMMDLRVGKIVEVWKHPDSAKLYCEKIDIGNGEIRSIASGLQEFVPLE